MNLLETEENYTLSIIDFYKFRSIVNLKEPVPDSEIIIFEDCCAVAPENYQRIPKFRNCKIAFFKGTSKDFNDEWIKRTIFPNVKKIYINSEFTTVDSHYPYNRFEKEVWVTTFFYNVPRSFNICMERDFLYNLEYYKNKYTKESLYNTIKNTIINTGNKAKYYTGFI